MSCVDRTDEGLHQRLAARDPAALADLFDRFAKPMYAVAYRIVGSPEAAEDAVQDALIRAWRSIRRFDPTKDIEPWLFTITRRAALDVVRGHTRRRAREVRVLPLPIADDEALERQWMIWQVRRAIDALPHDERAVLECTYFRDLTVAETAQRLAIPVGTVKSRAARARARVGAALGHLEATA